MNENPGGTPNPLNPASASGAGSTNPKPPVVPSRPAMPTAGKMATTSTTGSEPVIPAANSKSVSPAAENRPVAPAIESRPVAPAVESKPVTSLDENPLATGRTGANTTPISPTIDTDNQEDPGTELAAAPNRNKKKTGLIIGIIAGLVVLIGGIVAAVILLMGANKGDAVAAAMQKIMSGDAPKNVAIDGTINILMNDESSMLKRLNISLDSDIMVGSMINTSSAVLTFTDRKDNDYSVKVEEIYANNNNLFFKIEGAADAIKESELLNLSTDNSSQQTNCIEDASGNTNCETPIISVECEDDADCAATGEVQSDIGEEIGGLLSDVIVSIIEGIDGTYIRVSAEDLNLVGGNIEGGSKISCVTDLVANLDKNSNSTIQLYNKYPFISSTSDGVIVASKQNPIYKISLDSKNFTNFVNGISNTDLSSKIYSCLDLDDAVRITEEDIDNIVNKMPKIYAEVNADNNFTRLYLESDVNDGAGSATIDLGFSYPTSINVSEPVEYKDFKDAIQTFLSDMYKLEQSEASSN